MKKRAIANFSASFAYQILNLLVGLILPKYYTEIFGSIYNGLNQTLSQIMSLFAILQMGIAAASIQQMFQYIAADDFDMVNAVYQNASEQYRRMGVIFLIAAMPTVFLYPILLNEELPYWIIVSFFLLRCIAAALEYFFQAKYTIILTAYNRSYYIYCINILLLLFGAGCHLMVLITVRNILIYQAVALLSALIRLLIVGSYIRRQFPFLSAQTDVVYIPPKQVQRRHVLVSEIAGLVIDSTDLVVLSTFSGLISASIYSVYSFVTSGIGNILSSCREAVFAGIGRAYFSDFEGFKRKMDRFESLYFSITFFLYTTTILLYKPFITVYTKKMDAGYVLAGLPILFVLAKLLVNLRIPAIVAINTAGHFEQVKNYAVIEAAINLILSLLFVRAYGIYGVLGGTIIGSLYRTPILIRYSNKQIYKRSAFCYWKKILIWLPVFAASYVLSFYVPISCTSLTMWIVMAVPTATIVFAVCILWMMLFDKTTFHFLRRIVLHRRKAD